MKPQAQQTWDAILGRARIKRHAQQTWESILDWAGYGLAYSEHESAAVTSEQGREVPPAGTWDLKLFRDAFSTARWPSLPAPLNPRGMRAPGFLNRFVGQGAHELSEVDERAPKPEASALPPSVRLRSAMEGDRTTAALAAELARVREQHEAAEARLAEELAVARATAEEQQRTELARVREETERAFKSDLERARVETAQLHAEEMAKAQAEADRLRERAAADARAAAESAAAKALQAELARVREEAERSLAAQLSAAQAETERLRDQAAADTKTPAEAEAARALQALALFPPETEDRRATELERAKDEAEEDRAARLAEEDRESQLELVDAGQRRREDLRIASLLRNAASSLHWPPLPAFLRSRAARATPSLTDLLRQDQDQDRQDPSGPDGQLPQPQASVALERLHDMLQSDALQHSERLTGAPDNPADDVPNRTDDDSGVR